MVDEPGDAPIERTLSSVARLLDVDVRVTGSDEWAVSSGEPATITVGTGWYARWGMQSDRDTLAAAAILDLWATARLTSAYPARARRRLALSSAHPEYEPLFTAVDQLQAAGELLSVFPGHARGLERATIRRLPEDLRQLPWAHQFVVATVRAVLGSVGGSDETVPLRVDPPVHSELDGLPVPRIRSAMRPPRQYAESGMHTQERLLGLLLPAVQRLVSAQERDRGLTDAAATGARGTDEPEDTGLDLGSDTAAASTPDTDGRTDERDDATAAEQERARQADRTDTAEGADLFEAQQAADISALLQTPLPVTSPAMLDLLEVAEAQRGGESREVLVHGSARGSSAETAVSLRTYRNRLGALWPQIERMRDVWSELLHERVSTRRTLSRLPRPDGEELHRASLPLALAEARAGIQRPSAYAQLELDHRNRDEPGNTDYVLVIDRSGSMRVAAQAAADAALVMMESLAAVARDIEDVERKTGVDMRMSIRTSLIVFDSDVTVVKPLATAMDDASRARLYDEVLTTRGGTNDALALETAHEALRAEHAHGDARKRVIILVSDGESSDTIAAAAALTRVRSAGVRVIGIGVASDEVARRFAPDGIRVDNPNDLVRTLRTLVERTMT